MGLIRASSTDGKKGFDRRVFLLDSGGEGGECICVLGCNGNLVGGGIYICKCAEKMGEKGGVDVGCGKFIVWKPVDGFNGALGGRGVEMEQRKEGEEEEENRIRSH